MVGTEEAQFFVEIFAKPTIFVKLKKSLRRLFTSSSGIINMRNRLIKEYKLPFIERIKIDSLDFEDSWSKQMIIDHFDERIKTLPEEMIMDLYGDYLKSKTMKTASGRDAVNNYILHFLELSYNLDTWFSKEKMVARSKKKRF